MLNTQVQTNTQTSSFKISSEELERINDFYIAENKYSIETPTFNDYQRIYELCIPFEKLMISQENFRELEKKHCVFINGKTHVYKCLKEMNNKIIGFFHLQFKEKSEGNVQCKLNVLEIDKQYLDKGCDQLLLAEALYLAFVNKVSHFSVISLTETIQLYMKNFFKIPSCKQDDWNAYDWDKKIDLFSYNLNAVQLDIDLKNNDVENHIQVTRQKTLLN